MGLLETGSIVRVAAALALSLALFAALADAHEVSPVPSLPAAAQALPMITSGRSQRGANGAFLRQWPGTYFETAFRGGDAFFEVGPGDVGLRIVVDGDPAVPLVKPAPGFYRIEGLGTGSHRVRVDVASESQAGPTGFGGFYAAPGAKPMRLAHHAHQIEFIGDSYTAGYGNTSATRQCTEDEVWTTTDASRGIAPLTAAHYDADYQVNAISGRGIVRNYDGFAGDALPGMYPYVLFDKADVYRDPAWRPRVIAIGLGTNDFSTALHPGERWKTRDELHADYEASYVRFVQVLRAGNPHAWFTLWTTDGGDGEVKAEVARVIDLLHQSGETRVDMVAVPGLAMSACNYHPSVADDASIAAALTSAIDSHRVIWDER